MDWRGFELHPETPLGGVPVSHFFPQDQLTETQQYLTDFAGKHGVTGMTVSEHVPNTRRALAVAEFARDQGKIHPFREAAMNAFWRGGEDLEDDDDLRHIAAEAGLDPHDAVKAADDPEYQGHVDRLHAEAKRQGVTAIPAFFFGNHPFPVVGCQPYERLARAAEQAGARKRSA